MMIGYKAFDKNLICRNMQYEIGKTYVLDELPILCKRGFHFCKTIAECYNYYPLNDTTRICVVEALGDIATDGGDKYCTNKIMIVEEVTEIWKKRGNVNDTSIGFLNTGNYNTGNYNLDNFNSGDDNSGNHNAGGKNVGDYNTGDGNIGDCNTGNHNYGNFNTGSFNIGNRNTGRCNNGSYNVGDFNLGSYNIGIFNTKTPYMTFFDKPSNWTYEDWRNSDAYHILNKYFPFIAPVVWVPKCLMTAKEREDNPDYSTRGGYLKQYSSSEFYDYNQSMWDNFTKEEKEAIYAIPNFDKEKFEMIMHIKIGDEENGEG